MAKNKYEEAFKKAYKGISSDSKEVTNRANAFADYTGNLYALPTQLKEEFKKRSDPTFDAKISSAEQATLGGAIEGLNKYQGVSNPFERRALAEKYQSGLSSTYTALTDEKTRRQNTLLEYIDKWTGLFGAEAKKEEIVLNTMKEELARKTDIAGSKYQSSVKGLDEAESKRRYEEQFAFDREKYNDSKARSGGGSGAKEEKEVESWLSSYDDKVLSGKMTREQVKSRFKLKFPNLDENLIYEYFSDNNEKKTPTEEEKLKTAEQRLKVKLMQKDLDEPY